MTVERVNYNWEDPLNLESQLTEEEIAIRYVHLIMVSTSAQPLEPSVTLPTRTARSAKMHSQAQELFC